MLARTVSHGNSAASWNMRATRPRRSIVPADGVSRSGEEVEQGLLPQPEAPTRHSSSPACTSSEIPSRAWTADAPWP